jgi:hypothetical protein
VDLVRDLLDKLVVDRHGREMGRVDSIVLDVPANGPPRVERIELGPAILATRVRPFLGRWVTGLEHALGIADGRPLRVPFEAILELGNHVKVDVAVGETVAGLVESRMRSWLSGLPGGS